MAKMFTRSLTTTTFTRNLTTRTFTTNLTTKTFTRNLTTKNTTAGLPQGKQPKFPMAEISSGQYGCTFFLFF